MATGGGFHLAANKREWTQLRFPAPVYTIVLTVEFQWDPSKDRANRAKHGIDFVTAARVFADPHVALVKDWIDEGGEQRWHALGFAADIGPLLLVVHVHQEADYGKEVIRIISARKASKRESRAYFQ